MSLPPNTSALKSSSNPLQDDELSDVTKREIVFWANKLKVTPSQLFSLSKGELDALLENSVYVESSPQREKQSERWERLNRLKQKLQDNPQKDRLKGGLDLLELLCNAAKDIETYLCAQAASGNCPPVADNDTDYAESSGDEYDNTYCVPRRPPGADPYTTYNVPGNADICVPSPYSDRIDSPHSQYQPNLFQPYGYSTPNTCPTFTVPQDERTYDVLPSNITYDVSPRNATYSVSGGAAGGGTYSCPRSTFNLSQESTPSGMKSSSVSGRSGAAGGSARCPPAQCTPSACPPCPPGSPDNWQPQQIHFICDADGNRSPTFRNYTDYSIRYGPCGSEETANSISVESFDDVSGKVTASSRTFTLPPACSPTDALELSRISPPMLASGSRRTPSASAARARSPSFRLDASTYTPPNLASGCGGQQSNNLSNISPPQLASGAGECPPPQSLQPQPRNPHLSAALRATTPLRLRPNRPYRPRRLC